MLQGGPGIVETLERIGLERLMSTPAPPQPATPGVSLGVPGAPGTGVLASRLSQLPSATPASSRGGNRQPRRRADLGTVPGVNNTPATTAQASSGLGTLSSMLFGRKGGLL